MFKNTQKRHGIGKIARRTQRFRLFRGSILGKKQKNKSKDSVVFTSRSTKIVKERKKLSSQKRFRRILLGTLLVALVFMVLFIAGLVLANRVWILRTGEKLPLWQRLEPFLNWGEMPHTEQTPNSIGHVKGLGGIKIPAYPGSRFVFEDTSVLSPEELDQVNLFLEQNSVYLLPRGVSIQDVYNFYKEKLPQERWEFVLERSDTDGYLVSGLYFVKEQIGLRIYTMTGRDIWYELLPAEIARQGLEHRLVAVKQQVFSVDLKRGTMLPPEAMWRFKVPVGFEYTVEKDFYTGGVSISITTKEGDLFLSVIPLVKVQGASAARLQETIKKYIRDKYGIKVDYNSECNKSDTDGVSKICIVNVEYLEGQDHTTPQKYLLLFALTEDNIIYVFDFGEYTETAYLYLTYIENQAKYERATTFPDEEQPKRP